MTASPKTAHASIAAPPADHVVISCEHGGNRIPPEYRHLFEPYAALLDTHRGYDFGALALAREMATALSAPLYEATVSRLLVDLNRSVGNPALHSEATRPLPLKERREIVDAYWRPHREKIEGDIAAAIEAGRRVVHIASHSFTPELHGQVRNADIGLLYDPRRAGEVALARLWKRSLEAARPDFRVRLNYPYAGKGDGLTSTLRRRHSAGDYIGIELEVNQALVVEGGAALKAARRVVTRSLVAALDEFARKAAG